MLSKKTQRTSPVTEGMLESALKETGLSTATTSRVDEYDQNEVYKVHLEGNTYFLKFFSNSLADPDAGVNEIETIKLLRSYGLPVPEIVQFHKSVLRNYAVYSAVRGSPLVQQEVKSHTLQCMDLLENLSGITSERFGYVHSKSDTFREYDLYDDYLNDVLYLALKRLDTEYDTLSMRKKLSELFDVERKRKDFSFCHNDLNPRHTFWENGSLTGLIDFEGSFFGGRLVDVASWVVALRETGNSPADVSPYIGYMVKKSNDLNTTKFYLARRFLISASWHNKRLERDIVRREFVHLSKRIICAPTEESLDQVFAGSSDG